VHALDGAGTLKWSYDTGDMVRRSPPVVGADGTIYLGTNGKRLYALNPDGTLKWRCNLPGIVRSSPAIGPDGTLYVGCGDGNLYAIGP